MVYGQSNCDSDSIRYRIAYNYVVNDTVNQGKIIAVSDSIVDIDRHWDKKELENLEDVQRKLSRYMENKYTWFPSYYSSCIAAMFGDKNKLSSNHVLFFSQIEDGILFANLLLCKAYGDKFDYDEILIKPTLSSVYSL